MENTFRHPREGLGNHRRTCPSLLHDESGDCSALNLQGQLGHGKSIAQIWLPNKSCGLNPWEVLRILAIIIIFLVVGEGVYRRSMCSEQHHAFNVILLMSCWAAWANHHLTSLINIHFLVLQVMCPTYTCPDSILQALRLWENIHN